MGVGVGWGLGVGVGWGLGVGVGGGVGGGGGGKEAFHHGLRLGMRPHPSSHPQLIIHTPPPQ